MTVIDAHYEARYYRGMHRGAMERLARERRAHQRGMSVLKADCGERVRQVKAHCEERLKEQRAAFKEELAAREKALQAKIVELLQEIALYRDKVKGVNQSEGMDFSERGKSKGKGKKKGGKRPGTKGGRQSHDEAPVEESRLELSGDDLVCPKCGVPLRAYLHVYFELVARNGGEPPDNLEGYLPWDLSDEVREQIESYASTSIKPIDDSQSVSPEVLLEMARASPPSPSDSRARASPPFSA